jgi:hypothetical protein
MELGCARVGHLDGNVSSTKSESIPSLPSRSEVTFLKAEPRAARPELPGWRIDNADRGVPDHHANLKNPPALATTLLIAMHPERRSHHNTLI